MWQKLIESKQGKLLFGWLGLFGSLGTLICCAIPSTLVLLGLGASLATFLGHFPQIIWLSENKEWVFGFSFLMLGLSYLGQRITQTQVCPIDKKEDCEVAKGWSRPIFWFSFTLNLIGVFYAFVLPRLIS
jgi:hypothetical protein